MLSCLTLEGPGFGIDWARDVSGVALASKPLCIDRRKRGVPRSMDWGQDFGCEGALGLDGLDLILLEFRFSVHVRGCCGFKVLRARSRSSGEQQGKPQGNA